MNLYSIDENFRFIFCHGNIVLLIKNMDFLLCSIFTVGSLFVLESDLILIATNSCKVVQLTTYGALLTKCWTFFRSMFIATLPTKNFFLFVILMDGLVVAPVISLMCCFEDSVLWASPTSLLNEISDSRRRRSLRLSSNISLIISVFTVAGQPYNGQFGL